MAKVALSLHFLLLLILFFYSGQTSTLAADVEKTWCIAKPSSIERTLVTNIEYACRYVSCRTIEEGGLCFYPNTTLAHASWAMNQYYQAMGRHEWNCDFKSSALIVVTNPSHGNCTM